MKRSAGTPIYPDANSTLRLTYGKVLPYEPADGVEYGYYTTLKGAMEKEDPDNWEFVIPAKLKQLYQSKDFGRYAMPNGEMPICFIVNTACSLRRHSLHFIYHREVCRCLTYYQGTDYCGINKRKYKNITRIFK